MPSSKNYKRNYREEYDRYQGKPAQKKRRAKRNSARRTLAKQGRVRLGDGMDVDHKNTNPNDNSKKNLRVQKKGTNRSFPRNKKAGKK